MADIYNFNNNNENEESCCPMCDLSNEFMDYVKECTSDEQLFEVLRELVGQASKLALVQHLQQENASNTEFIDFLIYGECDEE